MTNEIQIPQSFEDIALAKGRMLALSPIQMGAYMMGARDTYRHLNSKPSGLRWVRASDKLPLEAELKRENNICIRFHGIDYQSGVFSDGQFHIMIAGKWWPTVSDLKYIEWLDESPSIPTLLEAKTETVAQGSTGMEKKVHPVYKGWNSMKLIGRVKDRFQELIRKGWNWTGFYHGWLEGRAEMLDEMKKEWDAPLSAPTVEPGTGKANAVAFSEWAFKNYHMTLNVGGGGESIWHPRFMALDAHNDITTADLFDKYIRQSGASTVEPGTYTPEEVINIHHWYEHYVDHAGQGELMDFKEWFTKAYRLSTVEPGDKEDKK